MQPFHLKSSFLRPSCNGMDHYALQVFKDAMVRSTFDEGQLVFGAALSFLCHRIRDGVCLPQGRSVPREPLHC